VLTILIPVFNEENNIELIVEELKKIKIEKEYEILFVDDGSSDKTFQRIQNLSIKNKYIKCISFSRNFGHQIAINAGIDFINSDIAIIMDGDLQHPPNLIPKMLNEYDKGYNIVQMVKSNQGNRNPLIKFLSFFYYKIFAYLAGFEHSQHISDFRLIDQKVINELKKIKEKNVFYRGLVNWVGFNYKEINYQVLERRNDKSKYNFIALSKLGYLGIIGFTNIIVKIFFITGITTIFVSLLCFFLMDSMKVSFLLISLFSGINFVFFGMTGLYLNNILQEVRGRPNYIINKKIL